VRGIFRTVAAVGIVAVLAAAAGCGLGSAGKSSGSSTGGTTASGKFLGCMVTDTGGIDDKSFNQSSWQGMQAAAATDPSKISVTYLPSSTTADYASNISALEAKKCGIIVTVGFLMVGATEAAAKANPTQKFAIVDCSYASFCLTGKKEKNIDQLVFNTVQDGFLGGYLAAAMSKTHIVATYGGEDFGTVTIYEDGFQDGVNYYNTQQHASVKVLGWDEQTQKAASSATSPTLAQARRSPTRSLAMALTSSSRSRAALASGPRRRSRPRTAPARACRWSGWTPTAASVLRSTASTC